jgi:hypothetical protein
MLLDKNSIKGIDLTKVEHSGKKSSVTELVFLKHKVNAAKSCR